MNDQWQTTPAGSWVTFLSTTIASGSQPLTHHVDLAAGVIRVRRAWDAQAGFIEPKSAKGRRKVPIAAVLRDCLDEHLRQLGWSEGLMSGRSAVSPFVPTAVTGRAYSAWDWKEVANPALKEDPRCRPRRVWARAHADALDLITLHECRHTFVSLMIAAGVNIKAISTYAGHASVQVTWDRYGHLMPGNEDEAAGLLDAYLERANTQARTAAVEASADLTGAQIGAHGQSQREIPAWGPLPVGSVRSGRVGAADPDDLALALELAEIADAITLPWFRAEDLLVETKPDLTPVSEADTAVEEAIRDRLAMVRTGDSIVGEEYGASTAPDASRRWIVDPIDGTKNYVRGVPVWATLLALEEDSDVTVGVVSAPALGRRWWASRGGGAFMDDRLASESRSLRVSGVRELADAQLSFAGLEEWEQLGRTDAVLALARACWRTRSIGDFWAYMLVAEGAMEVALDPVVSLWDLAAPQVIVEEAGGRFTDLSGQRTPDGGDAIATNGRVHEASLRFVGR